MSHAVLWIGVVLMPTRIRIDADADPYPDSTPKFPHVGKSGNFGFFQSSASLRCFILKSAPQVSKFLIVLTYIEIFWKKVWVRLRGGISRPRPLNAAGSRSCKMMPIRLNPDPQHWPHVSTFCRKILCGQELYDIYPLGFITFLKLFLFTSYRK
jgi:hypothetical protein